MGSSRLGVKRALSAGVLVLGLGPWLAAPAYAQAQGGGSKVAAEALFEQARALLAQGKLGEACPKFAESQRLDPSAGTLLNLASCYEKMGRTATAWATYREAASAASAAGRSDYLATAQRHAEALAPHLARLTTNVAQPAAGLHVLRDGTDVSQAEWGAAIPVDPGAHTVEASAPGYKPWTTRIEATTEGAQLTVDVPALEALPTSAAPTAVPPPPSPSPAGTPAPSPAGDGSSPGGTQRVLGVVIASVGVVGLGLSATFAVLAKNKYNQSLGSCQPASPDLCNQTGVSQRGDARTDGDIATVALSAGAAAVVGGAIVWLTAPRAASPPAVGWRSVVVSPTLGGALVQGAW